MDLAKYDPALVRDNLSGSALTKGVINNSNRRTNRRNKALARERSLIAHDMRRGLNTRRVTRALRRQAEGRRQVVTFRV